MNPVIICAFDYAFDYEPQVCWPNASNPLWFDEEEAFFRMHPSFRFLVRLAQARILQALLDLSGSVHIKNSAFNWIFSDQSDFRAWCSDAGYSIKAVRHKAKDIVQNGLKWRASAGDGKRYEERYLNRRVAA